ncbi:MAG: hypothetical protein QOH56_3052 [Pseudonocardiales bacterium]|jgi:hypothetical protein|nr:hypothetical protein [Pseudonocardiales bacterium]
MTDISTSGAAANVSPVPRRIRQPSWLDLRLIAGVVLVALSVACGALVVSSADRRQPVWVLAHEVSSGSVLRSSDLRSERVQLGAAREEYVPAGETVAGRSVNHSMPAGQLLPRSELAIPPVGVTVVVTLRPDNAPRVVAGERIALWVTTKTCRALVLLSGVAVQDVRSSGGSSLSSSATTSLLLRLPAGDAQRVMGVLDLEGAVLRAGLLSPGQLPPTPSPELDRCSGAAQ